jgi:hypothetical protein
MTKLIRAPLLRVGSAKRLTKGVVFGLIPEDGARPYNGA